MYWTNLLTEDHHWRGLELTVARRRTPPVWRIEFASPSHLRILCQGTPLLWIRFEPSWQGFCWLSGSGARAGALEPLRARDVERITEPPGSEDWYAAWARHFAQALARAPCSPLHEGQWLLLRASVPRPPSGLQASRTPHAVVIRDTECYPSQPLAGHQRGPDGYSIRNPWESSAIDLHLGLKPPSALSASRLKVWRKRARDGTLPPVLVLFITSLDGCVVLDGHHRWMAALEEKVPVPLLTLFPADVRRLEPDASSREAAHRAHRLYQEQNSSATDRKAISVKGLNALALEAWGTKTSVLPRTRVWPLPGRVAQWNSEVRARLDALGPAVEPSLHKWLSCAASW